MDELTVLLLTVFMYKIVVEYVDFGTRLSRLKS